MHFSVKIAFLCLLLVAGCSPLPSRTKSPASYTKAVITRTMVLPQVPSGSDLIRDGHILYIISDDAPYLYSYDLISGKLDSAWITTTSSRQHRMPREAKHDYEAAVTLPAGNEIVLFASGSKSPTRDVLSVKTQEGWATWNTTAFYSHLRKEAGLVPHSFNIEGALLLTDDTLLLLNRGSQQGFVFSWKELSRHLQRKGTLPHVDVVNIPLPPEAPYTYSGLAWLGSAGTGKLVFCASQEATDNAQSDGAVLGSAVGILNHTAASWQVQNLWPLYDGSGEKAFEKLEGILPDPTDRGHNGRKFIAITDNDDGQSKLLWIELR